jgi:predicted nucleic acid-binding protein
MPGKMALDSSAIAAMFFKEEASERALKAAIDADIITLDLSFAEVGNVAWKKAVLSGADKELTKRALEKCMSFIFEACDVVRFQDLALDAYEISIETKTTFYDSLFLALAEKEQVPLLTLDRRMYDRAKGKVNMKRI